MRQSIGNGFVVKDQRFGHIPFKSLGRGCMIEDGTRIFQPERIEIGDEVYIGHEVWLRPAGGHIRIGRHSWIGPRCFLHGSGGIEIGAYAGIGPYVKFIGDEHVADDPDRPVICTPCKREPIVIGTGTDVGCGTVIVCGVRVGENVIVGAGAVICKDIPRCTVAVGVPARVIRDRKPSRDYGGAPHNDP